jgi:6-phosphogluconolactonase
MRAVKKLLGFLALSVAAMPLTDRLAAAAAPKEFFVYFGTYNRSTSKGIYRARLEVASGKLSEPELAVEARDPAFLAVHPNGRFLYAIDESSDPARSPERGVSAYALDPKSGALTLLNQQNTGGGGPCHLSVDATGRCVLVANYGGGSVVAVPLAADGKLETPRATIAHSGSSVHPRRQTKPYAHAITLSPNNRFALVPDLGIDQVKIYRFDAAERALNPNTPPAASLPPGSGPRHLAFLPNGRVFYVINELLCTIAAFQFDGERGTATELQTISTLPAGEEVRQGISTAEIAVHPSGKFVYGSNRGHNTIAVFGVEAGSGRLSPIEHQPTQGRTPRHFALDPTGSWLLAENQDSSTVVVFKIDAATGKLTPTGQSLSVPNPVCAVFVAVN